MLNKFFDLEIVSLLGKEEFSVEWVEVQGVGGSFLVGPDHSPLVSIIATGSNLIFRKQNAAFPQEIGVAAGGIFKVENNKATVLLDS